VGLEFAEPPFSANGGERVITIAHQILRGVGIDDEPAEEVGELLQKPFAGVFCHESDGRAVDEKWSIGQKTHTRLK